MRRLPYKSAAAPTSHSVKELAKFNAVCRFKPSLLNETGLNAVLLPYLTYRLDSANEWSGV